MNPSSPSPRHATQLTLRGPDALAFAHAQFTSDVTALASGSWQWSAWLDARGRVQGLFQLARLDEHTLVALLRGGDAATLGERLGRYVFRSKVTLTPESPRPLGGGPALAAFRVEDTHAHRRFGLGDLSLVIPADGGDDTGWRLEAIRRGEPWLPDAFLDTFLPPALGLRRLGALSLDKGCFPGQEIAARLHYHGGHKYTLAHLRLDSPANPGAMEIAPILADAGPIPARILDCVADGPAHAALAVLHESAFALLDDAAQVTRDGPRIVRRFAP